MGVDNQANGVPGAFFVDATTPILVPSAGSDVVTLEKTVANSPKSSVGRLHSGEVVDNKYRIVELVGRGGMAEVYRATDIKLGRDVALKVILHAHNDDEQIATRFEQEAKAVALLPTDRVVQIHDLGRLPDSRPYMVLCFAEGTTLADALSSGPISWQQAFRIAIEISEGLAFAHDRCVLHRDIKPSNIMLLKTDDDRIQIKILDFGIAKIMCSDDADSLNGQRLTRTGEVFGSPMYMSPEQCVPGRGIDERTDIYALGCVLYEMLSGQPPFIGENAMMTMYMHSHEAPRHIETPPGLEPFPQGLDFVVFKALEKDPDRRYQSMREFKDALTELLTAAPAKKDYLASIGLTGNVSELSDIANRIRSDRAARKAEKKRKRNRVMALVVLAGVWFGSTTLGNIQKWVAGSHDDKPAVASLPAISNTDDEDNNDQDAPARSAKHGQKKKHARIEMNGKDGLKIIDGDQSVSIGADGINVSKGSGSESKHVVLSDQGLNVTKHSSGGTKEVSISDKGVKIKNNTSHSASADPLGPNGSGAIIHDEF